MSKTMLKEWLVMIVGALALIGIDLPLDQLTGLLELIFDSALEGYLIISAAIGMWLRKVTTSKLADGIAGWLGLRE